MEILQRQRAELDSGTAMYLDVLRRLLTASLYEESAWRLLEPKRGASGLRDRVRNAIITALRRYGLLLVKYQRFDPDARSQGEDQPMFGLTMVGTKRLENIQTCLESVLADKVPGDFIECGVWRGGSSIYARAVLKAYGVTDRSVWLADSFEGMPKLTLAEDLVDPDLSSRAYMSVSLEQVKENFRKLDLLDDKVKFLKGWFADTLPNAAVDKIAVLRLDSDHYSSTMDTLNNLYDKVSVGGYVIVDDYNWEGCRNAISEFRAKHKIKAELIPIDRVSVYWRR
jgi:hypothetical protein